MTAIEEKFVPSGELQLWTERFGDAADPVVLLVMGTSAPGIGWPGELVETLVAGGRQVIRYDHRDTGRSSCVDFAALTEDRLAPLSSIKAPTLVVHGTEDPLRPLPHGEAVAAAIPHARLETIPGMGHSFLSPGLPRRMAELVLTQPA